MGRGGLNKVERDLRARWLRVASSKNAPGGRGSTIRFCLRRAYCGSFRNNLDEPWRGVCSRNQPLPVSTESRIALEGITDLLKRSKELRLEAGRLIKKAEGMEAIIAAAKKEAAHAPEPPTDTEAKSA
jgi:hypothetical protein